MTMKRGVVRIFDAHMRRTQQRCIPSPLGELLFLCPEAVAVRD